MRHLEKQELDTLRHLYHDLPKMLQIGEENAVPLDYNYTVGRRRDTQRPNWEDGEHYLPGGKNIDGVVFDILGDKWIFYIRTGSGHPYLMVKIITDYRLEPSERRSTPINAEISFDRLDRRIVHDVREFYKFTPLFYDFHNDNGKAATRKVHGLKEPTLRKPK